MQHPTGTVAFLFTDIEGSTRLWEERRAAMDEALSLHDSLLREAIAAEGGVVFSTAGDGFSAAFDTPVQALRAAIAAQRALDASNWPADLSVMVRMGLHVGVASERDGDYFGPAVNRAARLMGLAAGGQVVVSSAVEQLTIDQLPTDVELVDRGEHELRGTTGAERVFQVLAPGLRADLLPTRPATMRPGSVPTPATTFVGRHDEVKSIAAELGRRAVVTLVGPGGMGKTRLAIEAAHAVAADFPDGAWCCELAAVEASGVAPVVASVVGAVLRPGEDPLAQIAGALAGRRLLLLLDNCEHVLTEVAAIVRRILTDAPTARLLCTSRAPLHVAGEQLWPVEGLAEAGVDLFHEHASAQLPDFAPGPDDVAAIAAICKRLDGMPLAIELAAARVRSLSPLDISARLDERFRLLRDASDDPPARQKTLRGTVQWSYDLLDEPSRLLFERLSVFAGTFGLDAVESVCIEEPDPADGTTVGRDDVVDLLDVLVDRSMLACRPSAGRGTRYSMLETLRRFAAEQLERRTGGASPWTRRHARHYRDVVLEQERRLSSADEPAAWRALAEDWDNVRAAFLYGCGLQDADVMADIPAALGLYGLCSLRAEVGEWAQRAVESGLLAECPVELDVRGTWAIFAYWLGADFAGGARVLGPDPGPAAFTGRCSYPLGAFMFAQANGDWDRAEKISDAWVRASGGVADEPSTVLADATRAIYGLWGDDSRVDSLGLLDRAAARAAASGSATLAAYVDWFRGLVLLPRDPAAAVTALQGAIDRVAPLADTSFVKHGCLVWVSTAAALGDDAARACALTREVLSLAAAHRLENTTINELRVAALLLARHGDIETAAMLLGAADASGHSGRSHRIVLDPTAALIRAARPDDADALLAAGRSLTTAAARVLALDRMAAIQAELAHSTAAEPPPGGPPLRAPGR